ncbi:MAG TPA: transcriptional activator NhaR [Labilithrix sp.]|nr:transcriptional activator NhaR [Labilithrix sp.]
MQWLNFHHLLLFTTLVRQGSLVAAGRVLRLSHSTLSAQIRAFEHTLGAKLVERRGRHLVPTELGQRVYRYGEQIFDLGRELMESVEGRGTSVSRLRVGIVDVMPKLIVRRLLQPLLAGSSPPHLICVENTRERMLAQLGLHEIDLVLSDSPVETGGAVRAYNHSLGACEVSFFGAKSLQNLRENFPSSLDRAPMLLPLEGSMLRRSLNGWFAANRIRPRIVGEFEDSALLKVIAQDGLGAFAAPAAVEREIERQYGVNVLGRVPQVREQFFAISLERRIQDPLIAAIFSAARRELFLPPKSGRRSARSGAGSRREPSP